MESEVSVIYEWSANWRDVIPFVVAILALAVLISLLALPSACCRADRPMNEYPQFSLKSLFMSTALVAAGLASLILAVQLGLEGRGIWGVALFFGLWVIGGGMLGGGVMYPLRKFESGWIAGVLIAVILGSAKLLAPYF